VTGAGDHAWWLDASAPHEPEAAAAQMEGLETLLAPPPRRVLDLGCGTGRVLVPLAAAGHRVVGVDRDPATVAACAERLRAAGAGADLVTSDFADATRDDAWPPGPFDAVLCLGNTLMTIPDVDVAVAVLERAASVLAPRGVVVLDDCPADFWPEVAEGNWQTGTTADRTTQLVWSGSDAVFALRTGDDVDPAREAIEPGERRYRLWSDGALRLAARAAGLSAPTRHAASHLLVLSKGVNPTGPAPAT
jgi:SAM-dependent methyltransferase